MKITVSPEVASWYVEHLDLKQGDALRFYGKVYGGKSGFSLTVMKMEPTRPFVSVDIDGIAYYIEHGDAWYFEGKNLLITLNEAMNEPSYSLVD